MQTVEIHNIYHFPLLENQKKMIPKFLKVFLRDYFKIGILKSAVLIG